MSSAHCHIQRSQTSNRLVYLFYLFITPDFHISLSNNLALAIKLSSYKNKFVEAAEFSVIHQERWHRKFDTRKEARETACNLLNIFDGTGLAKSKNLL